MPMLPIACAILFAKDVHKLANFYATVFEMAIVDADQSHHLLRMDGFELVIRGIPEAIAMDIEISTPPALREECAIKICLPVKSLPDSRRIADQNGGQLAATSKEWEDQNFRVCDGNDPEGNVFQARQSKA
jgi:predicted enzyme related to lactoylglutathione lyase